MIYYGLKQFQKNFKAASALRLRPAIPATLLGLTTGFYYGRTAAPGCLQNLMNIPNSAVAEEVKIIMRELYEQSPSSTTGQTIANRYNFVLESTTTSLDIPEGGFWEVESNSGDDWKEVGTWQADSSPEQKPVRRRVGPRNPDKRRMEQNRANKDMETVPRIQTPSQNSDYGLTSLPEESSKLKSRLRYCISWMLRYQVRYQRFRVVGYRK